VAQGLPFVAAALNHRTAGFFGVVIELILLAAGVGCGAGGVKRIAPKREKPASHAGRIQFLRDALK